MDDLFQQERDKQCVMLSSFSAFSENSSFIMEQSDIDMWTYKSLNISVAVVILSKSLRLFFHENMQQK